MSEKGSLLPENRNYAIPPLVYALVSNAMQIYGIVVLGWHFFPILYLWWWEELILSIFGFWGLKRMRAYLLTHAPEIEVKEGETSAKTRFFLLAVYFVFIVVLAGFMFAPDGTAIQNILTIFFRNQVFNLNLLFFVGMHAWLFWQDYYHNPRYESVPVEQLRSTFDTRSAIIHAGLLIGAFLSYLLPKFNLQTEHAFMFGFMAVKTLVELWQRRKG
ncbi:MAG: hypothetical protein JNN28_08365 [Saprospiraceae bacterium]|nr:hypothetical protein [Saprospiraceae bacterium]